MQIQINTDHHIPHHASLTAYVTGAVENALSRFSTRITRVEVHLSDVDGGKHHQNEKHCVMEARLKGHQPDAVTHEAATVEQAVDGAAEKLAHLIESTTGRLRDEKRHRTDPAPHN